MYINLYRKDIDMEASGLWLTINVDHMSYALCEGRQMDTSSLSRPVRRRAHVCRMCDLDFSCKAELLEHEQDAHSTLSSKRRSVPAHPGGSASAGTSPVKLHPVGRMASMNEGQAVIASQLAVNLLVDHEEVLKSCRKAKSADILAQSTVAVSTLSVPQIFVSNSSASTVKRADLLLTNNPPAGSLHSAARAHDQYIVSNAEDRSVLTLATSMTLQSTGSLSTEPNQASYTGVQDRGPVTVVPSTLSDQSIVVNKLPAGDVITAVGLTRKENTNTVTVTDSANSDNPDVVDDDTKPPGSDIYGTKLDSRHVTGYKILGSINEEPAASSESDSDLPARHSRDFGMQVSPSDLIHFFASDLTKKEASDCVVGLHHGNSYATPVNNDELQLLAAVSSTRSRDIVETKPEMIHPIATTQGADPTATTADAIPGTPEEEQQQMPDVVIADPMIVVEQEVVLETLKCENEPRRVTGRLTKRPKSPVRIVNLPMTPRQFTATDGAKKRMVAFTVAQPQRMVSVLLRNRHSEEQEEQQATAAEANVELPEDKETDDGEKPSSTLGANVVVESESVANVIAEVAVVAAAKAVEAGTSTQTEMAKQDNNPKFELCMYCEQPFPLDEIAEHITLDHVCDQCGRRFRQPANLRKVIYQNYVCWCICSVWHHGSLDT